MNQFRSPMGHLKFFFVVVIGLALFVTGCQANGQISPNKKVSLGTKVEDLDLSGLRYADGMTKTEEWEKEKVAQNITLVYNETEIPVALLDLGVSVDQKSLWENIWANQGKTIQVLVQLDKVKANQVLLEKLASINQPAKDAAYRIENNQCIITEGVMGKIPDVESIMKQIENHSFSEIPQRLSVTLLDLPPHITTEAVKTLAFDGIVGEYSTKFNPGEINRSANLAAAAKAVDQKLLQPGEIFSFNDTVGPRTPETGYKDAYIIVNNKFVLGTGGGICQVTSTLYNTAILADLEIVSRVHHDIAVAYVPLGQDATVNYPSLDFKFKNNTQSLIYIRSYVHQGTLTVQLYGKKTGKTVRFVHETLGEKAFTTENVEDPALPKGQTVQDQAGHNGYTVKSWKIVKDPQGNETETLLGVDEYAPANRIVRVGTKDIQAY